MTAYAAVVLSGGAARRMGGVDKPARPVGGRPMLHRVLAAVADAAPRIVVGPAGPLPEGVRVTREQPPGGGPVAATVAGLALLDPGTAMVALLAADLPLLTPRAVADLRRALDGSTVDGACYVDGDGRRQQLCGVWRVDALRAAVGRLAVERGGMVDGAPVRGLLAGMVVREVSWSGSGPPPWFDCDTDEDVRRAEEWAT
ncbi:NTP transferase domain-containing protein [Micromonospora sp. DR5-3]|uniref:molybdenum cofactor guanylyltransferase n=1 Tax=unclassified Micromonospora TaxID=2617518 RepID=UPI0011D593B5|nr:MULTISPECIES: NTP transferase domain-containing protein [unclassified Micromonospora]MCW3816568.1 NTP transferase domain-containing protein [Micromonospora sp. DR5-3]TYC23132.1 NTP transferase domain-containing protein [Micromonospora sp. MP36]